MTARMGFLLLWVGGIGVVAGYVLSLTNSVSPWLPSVVSVVSLGTFLLGAKLEDW